MTTLLSFDNTIDLNSLFQMNLSYNFDTLKSIMELLLLNSKAHDKRIIELEREGKDKDTMINKSTSHLV